MRESIGTAFMLNFIILFIFLVIAFLAGTFSYYRAYRVNSFIVNAIEKYEGYNQYSKEEIDRGITTLAYATTNTPTGTSYQCPDTWKNSSQGWYDATLGGQGGSGGNSSYYNQSIEGIRAFPDGTLITNATATTINAYGDLGYCVYLYDNDDNYLASGGGAATTDVYYHYGVLTYMTLRFPVIENILRIPIFSRTNRMYKFVR